MASTSAQEANEEDKLGKEFKELILSLPREKGWALSRYCLYEGFWCPSDFVQGIISLQNDFQFKHTDVFVCSCPKSGTTWLRALTFAILNRQCLPSLETHPLFTSNSHELVPSIDCIFPGNIQNEFHHLSNMTEPRLFGFHIPFHSLPKSIKESKCRILYICRNPFDTFVSAWNFINKLRLESAPSIELEEAFEMYCKGITGFGPWWNHMLGYWKESIATPDKVLFFKYEDLKEDVNFHVRRMAKFLGCPFTQHEESSGVIESIIKLCSFETMKELDANKCGKLNGHIEKKYLFRKAEIGDWINYLSPSMVEKLSKVIEEKLSGSGLSFRMDA